MSYIENSILKYWANKYPEKFRKLNKKQKLELVQLNQEIIQAIFKNALRYGEVNIQSKDIIQDFMSYIEKLRKHNVAWDVVIDHTENILKYARYFNRLHLHELSCLLYATWFEHWINSIVETALVRKNISRVEIIKILREVNIRDKISWLFKILGLKSISQKQRNKIIRIMDLRNNFVHYKWVPKNIDEEENNEKKALKGIDNTVRYLHGYDKRLFVVR